MKLNKRAVALLISLALLATAVVGTTVAFIFASSGPVNNTFTPAKIACEVQDGPFLENNEAVAFKVKNTGDADCYIRVALILNWVHKETGNIYAQKPIASITPCDGWFLAADGYYYCKQKVDPEAATVSLISVLELQDINLNAPSAEHQLAVKVVASAIQATADAVAERSNAVQVAGEVLARK